MAARPATERRCALFCTALICPWLIGIAAAQTTQTDPETTVPPRNSASAAPDLTVESVDAQLKAVQANAELEEAAKQRLVDLYTQTIASLQRASDWSAKAEEFKRAREQAPDRLQALRAELAEPPQRGAEPGKVAIEVPPDASLQVLEQKLAQAEAELRAARENAAQLDEERKRRGERRTELPTTIAELKKRLGEANEALDAAPAADSPAVAEAAKQLLRARQRSMQNELRSHEEELASYDARGELLTARRDVAARTVAAAEQRVKAWQEVVNERRRMEAEAAAKAVEKARREAAHAHPDVLEVAKENSYWVEQREALNPASRIEAATALHNDVTKTLDEVVAKRKSVVSKMDVAGMTHAMGLLLRRAREQLPDVRVHQRNVAARENEISQIQVDLIEFEDKRSDLANIERQVQEKLEALDPRVPDEEHASIANALRELLQARRGLVDALIGDLDSLLNKLADLDSAERRLIEETQDFASFIDERILWIRSTAPPRPADIGNAAEFVDWFIDPDNWVAVGRSLQQTAVTRPGRATLGVVLLSALAAFRRRMRHYVREAGVAAAAGHAHVFLPTLGVFGATVLVASLGPAVLAFIGWSTWSPVQATDFSKGIGMALVTTSLAWFTLALLRQICRPGGLGEGHFGWPAKTTKTLRRNINWLTPAGLPVVFVVAVTHWSGEDHWQNSLGRLAFVVGNVLLTAFAVRVLAARRGALAPVIAANPSAIISRLWRVWYVLAVGLPVLFALLAIVGYYYTAFKLAIGFVETQWVLIALVLLNGLALRWLLMSKRKLLLQKMRKRRAAAKAEGPEAAAATAEEEAIDVSSIDTQTRRLLRTGLGLTTVVVLYVLWADMLPALGILRRVEVWSVQQQVAETIETPEGGSDTRFTERPVAITLAEVSLALFVVIVTLIAANNVPGLLEIAILQRLPMQSGERYAISRVSTYVITIVGIVAATSMIGLGWSKVQWLAAAITVGLGFGLQEIFANFVSGLIILFERPIRIGDVVTVGDVQGRVTRIRIRATTITDWDLRELLVPNREFITGRLINWTLSDPTTRVVVPVGVAYGSDTQKVHDLLLQVARDCPMAANSPAPYVVFRQFGDSSLNFELRVYIATMDYWIQIVHELHMAIDRVFRAEGVEIAFPQRDLHIRSIAGELHVRERKDRASPPTGGSRRGPAPEIIDAEQQLRS